MGGRDKGIDRIVPPVGILYLWNRRADQGTERPMLAWIGLGFFAGRRRRSALDPRFQQGDLPGAEWFAHERHPRPVLAGDALNQEAVGGFAGNHRGTVAAAFAN